MPKEVTLEAVKEQFCIQDKREALCKLRERLDEILNPEEAAKLTMEIGEEMDKAFSAEGITLDSADRIVWAVKEAYIWGCLSTAEKFMTAAEMGYSALAGEGGRRMIGDKLEELAETQTQAVDALYLLLDGLDSEGRQVTQGPAAAENFVDRLRMYMGALHLITDTIEANGRALEDIAEKEAAQ